MLTGGGDIHQSNNNILRVDQVDSYLVCVFKRRSLEKQVSEIENAMQTMTLGLIRWNQRKKPTA